MPEKHSAPDDARAFYARRKFDTPYPNLRESQLPGEKESREDLRVYQGHSREDFGVFVEAVHSPEARETFETVCRLAEAVKEAGGRALLVGGAVRDEVLGVATKDFDVEVYGLEAAAVEEIVGRFGQIKDVGKAFGILKLSSAGGVEIDISLPRTDSKIGEGHRGFEVKVDPDMSVAEAAKRRDFTFNALSKDPLTGEIFDPAGGIEDLRRRRLRVTDPERFRDDPLRLLRGAQFVARFGLSVEPETMMLMREMVPELKEISVDRIRDEWEKMLLRALRPSMGLEMLNNVGVIDAYYPELAALRGSEQEFEWHPEGDVWVHTLMVVDAAKDIVERNQLDPCAARAVMLAALCHDLGKPPLSQVVDGRIRSPGHDTGGVEPTIKFLTRIGARKKETEMVSNLVREHIWPTSIYLNQKGVQTRKNKVTAGAFRRLAKRLHPATMEMLIHVVEADCLGTGPFLDPDNPDQLLLKTVDAYGLEAGRWMRQMAEEMGIFKEKPKPIISGLELIALGFKPTVKTGQQFGVIMSLVEECYSTKGLEKEDIIEMLRDCDKSNNLIAIERLRARLEQE